MGVAQQEREIVVAVAHMDAMAVSQANADLPPSLDSDHIANHNNPVVLIPPALAEVVVVLRYPLSCPMKCMI